VTILFWGDFWSDSFVPVSREPGREADPCPVCADTDNKIGIEFYTVLARANILCTPFEDFITTSSKAFASQEMHVEILPISEDP
jgi:hypothetical protein